MHARSAFIAVVLAGFSGRAFAQHEHHDAPAPELDARQALLDAAEAHDASGTAWQPASTPMYMWHWKVGEWAFGLHTNVSAGYANARGDRGDSQYLSTNWVMAMASHPVGDAQFQVRSMLSAEPWTVGDDGYPLLLQTGESIDGMPLHDRQHPHDLFMELAMRYRRPISDSIGVELYFAPVGEPALGPPAFPHRFTAMPNPLAPLGHHWQDSTHISAGVLTVGVFTRLLKVEGSWFNGREPDEIRYDLDFGAPDSLAARVTVNPTDDTSAQVSWARIDSPEALEPDISVQRATASLMWNRPLSFGDLALTGVFGRNMPSMGPATNAGLAESALVLGHDHTIFSRAELLQKTGHDLVLPAELDGQVYRIASFSTGYVYDVTRLGDVVPGIGFVATVDAIGSDLAPYYGSRTPWGGMVFLRLRPPGK